LRPCCSSILRETSVGRHGTFHRMSATLRPPIKSHNKETRGKHRSSRNALFAFLFSLTGRKCDCRATARQSIFPWFSNCLTRNAAQADHWCEVPKPRRWRAVIPDYRIRCIMGTIRHNILILLAFYEITAPKLAPGSGIQGSGQIAPT